MAYGYYRSITIDHTKCGSANSTDFPVLVTGTYTYLKTVGNGGKVESSSGYDIQFFSDSGLTTALDFERIYWNASTGFCVFRVRVGTLSASSDTVIYMAYGNAAVTTDQQDKAGTWSAGFQAVYHCEEASSPVSDSVAIMGDLSAANGSPSFAETGKIHKALGFTGGSDRLTSANNTGIIGNAASSGSIWIYLTEETNYYSFVDFGAASYHSCRLMAQYAAGPFYGLFSYYDDTTDANYIGTGAWHKLSYTYDGTTVKIYLDGTNTATQASHPGMTTSASQLYVGASFNISPWESLRGYMCNILVANVAWSASWETASYNNENSPSTFYTVGSEVGGSTTYTVTAGYGTTTETGQAVTPRQVHKLAAAAGTTTETGQAVTPRQVKIVTAAYGTTSESGQAVTLTNKYNLVAAAGTTSESGQAATLRQVQYLTAAYGTTTETGQGATPRQVKILTAGTGTTSESGQDVTLTIIGTNRVVADYGTITIAGQDVAIRHVRTLTAGTGTTTETGQGASVFSRAVVGAGTGTTSETGQPVALVIKYILGAGIGTTAETGQEVYLVLSSETVTLRGRLTVSAVSTHRTFAESQKSSTTKTQPVSTRTTYTEAP